MAFIPKGAKWYIAEVVLEHQIADDPRNVVHINTLLVEAASPEDAYGKAIALGQSSEMDYLNTDEKRVQVTFRGLRDLNVIHDDLEHGAELIYEEKVGLPESAIRQWIKPKDQMGVFAPIGKRADIPNYFPAAVMKLLEARLSAQDECQGGEEHA